ncbi:MAG: metallophosphoesterase family protein [Dongiaceae bacterium]
MFTLAHLSDPHLSPLPRPAPMQLMSKRILGFLSWTYRRKGVHDRAVLDALAADLARTAPDHVAITGDLVNISLPDEFQQAARWLRRLGPANSVTVIPGNHDAYVAVPWSQAAGLWSDYMAGSSPNGSAVEVAPAAEDDFPFVRRRGPLALVGVSTACPMPPHSAAGRLGPRQLAALGDRLIELGREKLFRVVLIHHPPFDAKGQHRKRLIDSAAFREVVGSAGAALVLHAHPHRAGLAKLATPAGHAPVIGVPSASARADHGGKDHSQYNLYRVDRAGSGWRVEVEVRGVTQALDRFVSEGRFTLAVPQ